MRVSAGLHTCCWLPATENADPGFMPSRRIALADGKRGATVAATGSASAGTALGSVVSGWSVPVRGGSSFGMLNVRGRVPARKTLSQNKLSHKHLQNVMAQIW